MKDRSYSFATACSNFRKDGWNDGRTNTDLEPSDLRGLTPEGVARREARALVASLRDRSSRHGAWDQALEDASSPGEARRLFRCYLDGYKAGIRAQVTSMIDPDGFVEVARERANKEDADREARLRRIGLDRFGAPRRR